MSVFMSAIDQFIRVADEYGRAEGITPPVISWRLFGDSKKYPAIKAGNSDLQTRRYERVLRELSAKWPASAVWPADVPRPSPDLDEAAA